MNVLVPEENISVYIARAPPTSITNTGIGGVQQPDVPLLHNTANLGIMVASICVASQSGDSRWDCLHSDMRAIPFSAFSTDVHI